MSGPKEPEAMLVVPIVDGSETKAVDVIPVKAMATPGEKWKGLVMSHHCYEQGG